MTHESLAGNAYAAYNKVDWVLYVEYPMTKYPFYKKWNRLSVDSPPASCPLVSILAQRPQIVPVHHDFTPWCHMASWVVSQTVQPWERWQTDRQTDRRDRFYTLDRWHWVWIDQVRDECMSKENARFFGSRGRGTFCLNLPKDLF